jgi:hypothetical protein
MHVIGHRECNPKKTCPKAALILKNFMSEDPDSKTPKFIGSGRDPGRAESLGDEERDVLCKAMESQVLPVMERKIRQLNRAGFTQVRLDHQWGMATLFAACEKPPLEARLRFHIHDTFAPLVTREPVFWMITIYRGNEMVMGVPGRLSGLEDAEAITTIVGEFVSACVSVRRAPA